MVRTFVVLGALSAAVSVAAGAFGAHGLKPRIEPRLLEVFETGARYQMYHALALLAVAWVASRRASPAVAWAGWLLFAGTVLFSGSLYAMALTGVRPLGLVTPFGGVAFIVGWVILALEARRI
jgi:uncharacterized membrane protein YgdD (TMEM256/DUF423 family)